MKLLIDKFFYHSSNAWFGIHMRPTSEKIRTSSDGDIVTVTATCSFNVVIKNHPTSVSRFYVLTFDKKDETKT